MTAVCACGRGVTRWAKEAAPYVDRIRARAIAFAVGRDRGMAVAMPVADRCEDCALQAAARAKRSTWLDRVASRAAAGSL